MDRKGSLNDAADDHPKDEIALEHIDVTLTEEAPSHHPLDRKVLWKVDLWLMPITCVLMMIAYLDRTAIGNARLFGLEQDLNMAGSDYNIALFMFFVPYILLDLPSNILMKRLRPSVYLSILMFCWGTWRETHMSPTPSSSSSFQFQTDWLTSMVSQGSSPFVKASLTASLAWLSADSFSALSRRDISPERSS